MILLIWILIIFIVILNSIYFYRILDLYNKTVYSGGGILNFYKDVIHTLKHATYKRLIFNCILITFAFLGIILAIFMLVVNYIIDKMALIKDKIKDKVKKYFKKKKDDFNNFLDK